jgi:preprotein translocase subunit SecE
MMAAQTEATNPKLDVVKFVLALGLLGAGLAGFYYYAAYPLAYRVMAIIVDVIAVLAILATTQLGKSSIAFMGESRAEVRRVIWPTRQETVQSTLVVVVLVLVVGIFLWLLDMLLFWGIGLLTGQKV